MSIHSFLQWLEESPLDHFLDSHPVLFPLLTAAHFLSFFVAVGTTVAVDFRVLGLSKRLETLSDLGKQLFPWTWVSYIVIVITGFLLFVPSALVFYDSSYFLWKLLVTILAGAFVILIQRGMHKWDELPEMPVSAKALAVISILLWICAILLGTHVPLQTGQ